MVISEKSSPEDVFAQHGKTFLDKMYPGTIMPPVDMAEAMASQNPDKAVIAAVAVKGGYDPCEDATYNKESDSGTTTSDSDKCEDGFYYDSTNKWCYGQMNSTGNFYTADTICGDQWGAVFDMTNDEGHLSGFLDYIEKEHGLYRGVLAVWVFHRA